MTRREYVMIMKKEFDRIENSHDLYLFFLNRKLNITYFDSLILDNNIRDKFLKYIDLTILRMLLLKKCYSLIYIEPDIMLESIMKKNNLEEILELDILSDYFYRYRLDYSFDIARYQRSRLEYWFYRFKIAISKKINRANTYLYFVRYSDLCKGKNISNFITDINYELVFSTQDIFLNTIDGQNLMNFIKKYIPFQYSYIVNENVRTREPFNYKVMTILLNKFKYEKINFNVDLFVSKQYRDEFFKLYKNYIIKKNKIISYNIIYRQKWLFNRILDDKELLDILIKQMVYFFTNTEKHYLKRMNDRDVISDISSDTLQFMFSFIANIYTNLNKRNEKIIKKYSDELNFILKKIILFKYVDIFRDIDVKMNQINVVINQIKTFSDKEINTLINNLVNDKLYKLKSSSLRRQSSYYKNFIDKAFDIMYKTRNEKMVYFFIDMLGGYIESTYMKKYYFEFDKVFQTLKPECGKKTIENLIKFYLEHGTEKDKMMASLIVLN